MKVHSRCSAALVAVLALGCGPVLVWHGRSPDRSRSARVIEEGGRQRVVVDDRPHDAFEAVGLAQLRWTERGLAYPAMSQDRWRLVVDGAPGPAYDALGEVVVSGGRLAYAAHDSEGWRVVLDGEPGPAFRSLRRASLRFVRDGRRSLYVARDDRGEHAVIDGSVGEAFDQVERVTVGSKGTMVAYVGWSRGAASVVVEREVRASYDEVLALEVAAFEPHWAAIAVRRGVPAIVRDGSTIAEQPGAMDLRISAEGTRVAWTARVDEREALFTDGRAVATHAAIEDLLFVPRTGALVYVARETNGARVVHEGEAGPRVASVDAIAVSDAGHYGYVAQRGVGRLVVVDGVVRFRGEWAGALVLAERSDRWAFVTRHGARRFVVTPEGATPIARPFVDTLVLDRDGAHWAIAIADRNSRRFEVVVDARVVAPLDLGEVAGAIALERDPVEVVRAIVAGELARATR